MCPRDGVAQHFVAGEGIEHVALHRGSREPQLVALPVHRDKLTAGLGERRQRDGAPVDARR